MFHKTIPDVINKLWCSIVMKICRLLFNKQSALFQHNIGKFVMTLAPGIDPWNGIQKYIFTFF